MRLQLVFCGVVGLGLVSGLGAWQLSRMGIHQGYAPEQPIAFPHKVHAGDNRIPCLYCHYGARTSRHAGIPSASVCMNCHSMLEKQTAEIEMMDKVEQAASLTMGWCIDCHRENAHLPTGTFHRAALAVAREPKPAPGL